MDTYRTMLFLHIVALAIGLSAGTVLVLSLFHLRDAATLDEAAPWGILAGHTEKAFPVAILGLFLTGGYMTSDVWSWSTGWILVSFIGLALLTVGAVTVGTRVVGLRTAWPRPVALCWALSRTGFSTDPNPGSWGEDPALSCRGTRRASQAWRPVGA